MSLLNINTVNPQQTENGLKHLKTHNSLFLCNVDNWQGNHMHVSDKRNSRNNAK